MAGKNTAPDSLYGNSRDILREAERENEILAEIAGETYEAPGEIPKGKYVIDKRLLDAAQKKNELLEAIAEGGGGSGSTMAIGIDYATDVISLKKNGETIQGSGATLPAYGLNYDTSTGGLTLTKNGTAAQGQTVALPDYGSPLTASSTSGMTDTDRVYVNTTDGNWYYYDGDSWEIGGTYNSQGIDTDTTLLVPGAPADAQATGNAVGDLKTHLAEIACAEGNYTVEYLQTLNSNGTWNGRTYTFNGISYTFDDNMNLTVSGTATANSSMNLYKFTYASPTNVTLVNPMFDRTDDVYTAIIATNGALTKYPKGVTQQTIPSNTQRIVVRVDSGKTVNMTSGPIEIFSGLINDFGLKSNLDNLQSEVDAMENDLKFVDILLKQGGINLIDGTDIYSSTRVRTSYFYRGNITVPVGYKILYAFYYDADTKAFDSKVNIDARSATVGRSGYLVRLSLSTTNATGPVTPTDFKGSLILEEIETKCDNNSQKIEEIETKCDNNSQKIGENAIHIKSLEGVVDPVLQIFGVEQTLARYKSMNSSGTWTDNAYLYNGITYTVNDDMSITVSGTATANSSLRIETYNLSEPTEVILINPVFDRTNDVYTAIVAPNGALTKYPKGVTRQTIPTGVQRIVIRVESGKTVNATTDKVCFLGGGINEFALEAENATKRLQTANYIPYHRYSYDGTILNPTQLKTEYSANNLLDAMYAFCDELMAQHPDFVAKETLQYTGEIVSSVSDLPNASSVANGTIYMVTVSGGYHQYICENGSWVQMHTWDDNGNPIYLAKLTYPMYAYTISPYKGCDYPVILWCSGLHGSEDWSNVSTLYLFRELLENRGQNDDIDYLLSNFVIKIIPCCGVSACADRTLGAHAMSENGVNPNRDYPVGWEESQDEWRRTGNYPWYDPYNRIIKTYIESLPNIVYCVNKHDSNTLTSDGFVNNIWDNYIAAHVVEDCAFKQLDLTIKAKYPWLLSEFVGAGVSWNPNARALCNAKYVYGGTYGTMEKWFNAIGIKGGLIETVCRTGAAYSDAGHDADFYRIALECDMMTLCAVGKNLNTMFISDDPGMRY